MKMAKTVSSLVNSSLNKATQEPILTKSKNVIWYNGGMKRKVYYVISCTSDENQRGIFHYSKPLSTLEVARALSEKTRAALGNDGHVSIELHHEAFTRNSWNIDHEGGGSEHVDYL